ncbi:MAG: hypothetical protein V4594_24170 [Bacteroidota bacterium]
MHFSEYKEYVILAYKRLRDNGDLSSNLERPTPAHIKRELLFVLVDKHKYLEKDLDTIRSFFGPKNNLTEYIVAIKNSGTEGTDKCRPLNTFLRTLEDDAEEGNTDDRNIYLLAILINFRPRPYVYGKTAVEDFDSPVREETAGSSSTPDATPPNDPANETTGGETKNGDNSREGGGKTKKGNALYEKLILITGIIVLVGSGAYFSTGRTKVYTCKNTLAKRYHLNPNCPSLSNCRDGVTETTMSSAKENGRTLCGFESK